MNEQNKNDLKKLAKELSVRGYVRRSNFILSMAGVVHVMPSGSNGDSIWMALTEEDHGIVSYDAGSRQSPIYYKGTGDSHAEFGTYWEIEWSPDQENWMPTSSITVSGGSYDGRSPTDTHKAIIRRLQDLSSRSIERRQRAEEAGPLTSPLEDEGERAQRVESPRATPPWSEVQTKLTQMGGTREDGHPLRIDGIWGNNTRHAWNQVTEGRARPANPSSAMQVLNSIQDREPEDEEQNSAARQEDIPRGLLAAYLMYNEERLTLEDRDSVLERVGMSIADNFDDAQDMVDTMQEDYVSDLYNLDRAAYVEGGGDSRIFNIILQGFLEKSKEAEQRPAETLDDRAEINLREYYNPSGTNIFMRKSDGALFFGMSDGDRDALFPLESRTQTRGGGRDYLTNSEQRGMLREVRRDHDRRSGEYRAYKDIIQGQRKFETGERNIFEPRGRAERGGAQRERGRETLRRQRRQEREDRRRR